MRPGSIGLEVEPERDAAVEWVVHGGVLARVRVGVARRAERVRRPHLCVLDQVEYVIELQLHAQVRARSLERKAARQREVVVPPRWMAEYADRRIAQVSDGAIRLRAPERGEIEVRLICVWHRRVGRVAAGDRLTGQLTAYGYPGERWVGVVHASQ